MDFLNAVSGPSVNSIKMQRKMQEIASKSADGGLDQLKGLKGSENIDKAAKGFASLFVFQMLEQMRKTVPESSLFGEKSYAMDVFNSMLDEKYANRIAERGSIGLTKMISDYLIKQYEKTSDMPVEETGGELSGVSANLPNVPAEPGGTGTTFTEKIGQYGHIIESAAQEVQLDPDLIKAVIAKESSGNPAAVSKHGAKGLMQLMDETAKEVGVDNPMDPEQNIRGGAAYLKKMLIRFGGNLPKALAAYNAGPGAVQLYDGIPPYPETRNYVTSVMEMREQFRRGEQI